MEKYFYFTPSFRYFIIEQNKDFIMPSYPHTSNKIACLSLLTPTKHHKDHTFMNQASSFWNKNEEKEKDITYIYLLEGGEGDKKMFI